MVAIKTGFCASIAIVKRFVKAIPGSCLICTIERKSDMTALGRHQGDCLTQERSHRLSNNMKAGGENAQGRALSRVVLTVARDDATCQAR